MYLIFNKLQKDNFGKQMSKWTFTHLDSLKTAIRSCGVGFSVWQNKEGKYEWPSLMGGDKKRVLRNLPDKLGYILKPNRKEAVIKLWKVRIQCTQYNHIIVIITPLKYTL